MSRELRQEAIKDLSEVDQRLEDVIQLTMYEPAPTTLNVLVQSIGAIAREVSLIAEILQADLAGNLND